MADDKPYRPKPLAGRNPKLPVQLSEQAAAHVAEGSPRSRLPAQSRAGRDVYARHRASVSGRAQRERKMGRLSDKARAQVRRGEGAAQSYSTKTRKLGRLMIKAGTKNVTMPTRPLQEARNRHQQSERRAAKQKTYVRNTVSTGKTMGATVNSIKAALGVARRMTASKIPMISLPSQVMDYKKGGGPSASQLLKGKAKTRQKKYTSGPKGHMKTLDYAGIHPGII